MSRQRKIRHRVELALLLAIMTVVFVFDDVLYFWLFDYLLEWHLSSTAKFLVTSIILVLNLLLAVAVLNAMRSQPTTGSEGMVGQNGRALTVVDKAGGWVAVRGERWQAYSDARIPRSTKVEVVAVGPGLRLYVRAHGMEEEKIG